MKFLKYILGLIISFFIWACNPKKKQENTTSAASISLKEVNRINLPDKLKEISGLSYVSNNVYACVNDEKGKLFLYNSQDKEIQETYDFADKGDYEGIEVIGYNAYILRSDGRVFLYNFKEEKLLREFNFSQKDVAEYEGIAIDANQQNLYLAAKETSGNDIIFKGSLSNETLAPFVNRKSEGLKSKLFAKEIKPSGLAIYPKNNDLWVLASVGQKILIFDSLGVFKMEIDLKKYNLEQPEGIAFNQYNQVVISSEGKKNKGQIVMFNIQALE